VETGVGSHPEPRRGAAAESDFAESARLLSHPDVRGLSIATSVSSHLQLVTPPAGGDDVKRKAALDHHRVDRRLRIIAQTDLRWSNKARARVTCAPARVKTNDPSGSESTSSRSCRPGR